jgi:hypothetical protein
LAAIRRRILFQRLSLVPALIPQKMDTGFADRIPAD